MGKLKEVVEKNISDAVKLEGRAGKMIKQITTNSAAAVLHCYDEKSARQVEKNLKKAKITIVLSQETEITVMRKDLLMAGLNSIL